MRLPRGWKVVVLFVVVLAGALVVGSSLERLRPDPGAGPPDTLVRAPSDRRIRVEVLNGSGLQGRAREATGHLRDRGFDVVFFGNAPRQDMDTSVVLDRVGRWEDASLVARALGIGRVDTEVDTTLYLDVSVLLGRDWVPDTEEPEGEERPWWDPRRYLRR